MARERLHPWRVELADANEFVHKHHRHHAPEVGHRFSLGVGDDQLRGVAICGRPKAAALDKRTILEVLRVATDGTKRACSWLYAASAQCATTMGFHAVITYTLATESGASLRAVGWWPHDLEERDGDWDFDGRSGQTALFDMTKPAQKLGRKVRWLYLTGNE